MRRKALQRKGMCDVFWGSHGCHKQRDHIGLHWCSNDCIPCDGDYVFGDDWDREAYLVQVADWVEHRRALGKGLPTFRPDHWRLPQQLIAEAGRRQQINHQHAETFDPGRETRALGAAMERMLTAVGPSPLTAMWRETARAMQQHPKPTRLACYDASFGRVHVRPGCRC